MPPLTTVSGSYRTLGTLTNAAAAVDTDLAAATGYTVTPMTSSVDLLKICTYSDQTEANAITLILNATGAANGDTLTQKIYGQVDQGPPQLIASIVWTIGTARVDGSTDTYLWADTAVVTDTHLTTISTADNAGGDRVASVSFDATGYRRIKSYITAQTGDPTLITSLYRYW